MRDETRRRVFRLTGPRMADLRGSELTDRALWLRTNDLPHKTEI